ncbi:MAG: hypothetical protein KJ600_03790 [Nanoarchaeota archaeon]|nr:hypothetical protein [Nanoarchaeota archaeon]MBU1103649.1 hypothetical protein [Nanoarchaeota archaeon]
MERNRMLTNHEQDFIVNAVEQDKVTPGRTFYTEGEFPLAVLTLGMVDDGLFDVSRRDHDGGRRGMLLALEVNGETRRYAEVMNEN